MKEVHHKKTSSITMIFGLFYVRDTRIIEHNLQVQVHMQDDMSACSEKSCDTLKFKEFVDKRSGDT